jgi:hypothetical protein
VCAQRLHNKAPLSSSGALQPFELLDAARWPPLVLAVLSIALTELPPAALSVPDPILPSMRHLDGVANRSVRHTKTGIPKCTGTRTVDAASLRFQG